MNETDVLILDSTQRLFAGLAEAGLPRQAEAQNWPEDGWEKIEALGLPLGLVPEEQGGFAFGADALLGTVRQVGSAALPLPVAETMLANQLVVQAGLEPLHGALSFAAALPTTDVRVERAGMQVRVAGVLHRVPWGRHVSAVVLAAELEGRLLAALLRPDHFQAEPGSNLAGEPRDTLHVDAELGPDQCAFPEVSGTVHDVHAKAAALRSIMIAGAVGQVLDLSVRYANDRVQFGRPIGKFQAIQQNLAVLAGQAAAATGAAELAAAALAGNADPLAMAIAKLRAGEAAGAACAIAHQVHGAIGFTREHDLQLFTRRLWSWRDEFGNEAHWGRVVGERVARAGADGLWPLITSI